MAELHITRTYYQEVPTCHIVECDCGDMYKMHSSRTARFCADCKVEMINHGHTVCVVSDDHDTVSAIPQCPQCKGLDLRNWGKRESILRQFQAGSMEVQLVM